MSGSYWRLFLVFAGLALTSPLAAQQTGNASGDQPRTEQSSNSADNSPAIAAAIDRLADEIAEAREQQSDPYGDDREQRERRDVVAQETMAGWAEPMFWAIVAQTTLALGALIALLVDLGQNRKSGEAQLRAYISIEPGGINEAQDGACRIPYNIANKGQTPAYELAVFGDILIVTGDPRQFNPETAGRLGKAEASTDITLGPGQSQWNFAYPEAALFEPFLEDIRDKKMAIVHYGFVQYRDAFGRTQKTCFAFYHWGEELSDVESKRCRFGNYAT